MWVDKQVSNQIVQKCPKCKAPNGTYGAKVLDDETQNWLLNASLEAEVSWVVRAKMEWNAKSSKQGCILKLLANIIQYLSINNWISQYVHCTVLRQ